MEKRRILKTLGIISVIITAVSTLVLCAIGVTKIFAPPEAFSLLKTETFFRQVDEEDFEDESVCGLTYMTEDESCTMTVNVPYEEWEEMSEEDNLEKEGYIYSNDDGSILLGYDHEATSDEINQTVKDMNADGSAGLFGAALAIGLLAIALAIVTFWGRFFSTYEKIWFLSILVLAAIISVIFPEESCNGINGIVIMGLYLLDTLLNILCELLISKQSKWNFIVSLFVEITEILICVVLAYRFATMVSTLFFWIPIDILSFVNWHKHPDHEEDDLTKVRKLSGLAEVLIIIGIVVWTVVVGWFLSSLDFSTDLFGGDKLLATIVCYLDACASAVGICNGLFIFFRIREQWIAWYICAALEAVINILSGQFVLLVLKVGYFTNTTYGYIKWSKYIKAHPELKEEKSLF